jgi:hypothetical protein
MGWLFMQRLDGHKGPKEYLDAQFTYRNDQSQLRVLRSTLVNRRVYYAAAERILNADNTRVVFAIVCLVKWAPRARDGYTFGYKDMDETVGPCECDCPAGILDLLTPTEYPYAIKWREKCRANLADRIVQAKKPKPKLGQNLVLAEPMAFTDGYKLSRFRVTTLPRRRGFVYQSLENGGFYRIPKLATRDYHLEASG